MDEPAESDVVLVARTLAGDRQAFGRLYDRYARPVRAVCLGAGFDAVADLTQESFLRAFRHLSSLREPNRFGPWVVGIARQVVREHRRRRRSESPAVDPSVDDPAVAAVDEADEIRHVLGLLARLPEAERLAVQFCLLSGRDADEAARLLGRSRSGTYAVLKRACGRLARWLNVPTELETPR
jgi:RNA polymerase sigma-70 factor (ECF subfamily)